MAFMTANRTVGEGAKIKTDGLVHLLEYLVGKLRIGDVAKILCFAPTSDTYPEGNQDQIARAAGLHVPGCLAARRRQYLARTVDLPQQTLGHGVCRGRGTFLHRMVRRKIDDRPAAFWPDEFRVKLAPATDARSHRSIGPYFLPPVEDAALGNGVEENVVIERRKTAVKGKDRLDVRVIVQGFPLEIAGEEPELFGDELLERILESIFRPVFLPAQTLPRFVLLENLHRQAERRRIWIHNVIDTPLRSGNRVNLHDRVHHEIERYDVERRILVAGDTEIIVERPGSGIDVVLFTEPGPDAAGDIKRMVEDVELLVTS